ncbi:hypothetical protein PROFUN_09448 [Planoprotostelium fungivorum]|uniref:Uncharacterized protein n=1 Tax=Planoprotostelium fungivorum TaxID=1890364 RepID=A0A2P6NGZ5_9EUKA|nr:hypothetical protein PROFUN_09448 [Planoprotostelium fungivorum]
MKYLLVCLLDELEILLILPLLLSSWALMWLTGAIIPLGQTHLSSRETMMLCADALAMAILDGSNHILPTIQWKLLLLNLNE